jgi:NAD(P)-dependent dehydrogenase (short-subunit alcohol dehydrogenase family)
MQDVPPLSTDVALITGGGRGIGLAIARRLGRLGARVAICGRNAESLESSAEALRGEGIGVFAARADVTSEKELRAFNGRVEAALGEVSILVNNAGIGVFGPAHEIEERDWDLVLNTNLKGAYLMSRVVAPQMIRRRRGHIIHISSLAGKNTFAGGGAYCASKWGLLGLAGCMAEDLRVFGIRVSVVCPGTVHTEFSPHPGKDPARMLQPEDVAHAVEMLVRQAPGSFISMVELRPTQKP